MQGSLHPVALYILIRGGLAAGQGSWARLHEWQCPLHQREGECGHRATEVPLCFAVSHPAPAGELRTLSCTTPPGTQGLHGEAESISAAFPSCSTGMARAALLCAHPCQHMAVPIVLPS